MNRDQRRQTERRLRKGGASAESAKKGAKLISDMDEIRRGGVGKNTPPQKIVEGQSVRLNIAAIKARKNYDRMSDVYKQFVEESEGKTFTAHVENDNLISLTQAPAWLFWSGDLCKEENNT